MALTAEEKAADAARDAALAQAAQALPAGTKVFWVEAHGTELPDIAYRFHYGVIHEHSTVNGVLTTEVYEHPCFRIIGSACLRESK